jgi:hypothetical protein
MTQSENLGTRWLHQQVAAEMESFVTPNEVINRLRDQQVNDKLEQAYWEFDARHKGYGQWRNAPQSERDAFKAVVRTLVGTAE